MGRQTKDEEQKRLERQWQEDQQKEAAKRLKEQEIEKKRVRKVERSKNSNVNLKKNDEDERRWKRSGATFRQMKMKMRGKTMMV